jgi:two-component system, NtrC family, response regulator AtoC
VIEDEDYDVRRIKNTLKPFKETMVIREVVSTGHAALKLLQKKNAKIDVIIMDFQISGNLKGENLIKKIKETDSTLQIIVITKMTINVTDFEFASSLLDAGAMWYCTKYPGDIEHYIYQPTDFILSIINAFEKRKLERQRINSNKQLQHRINESLENKRLVGESQATVNLRDEIKNYAKTDANILIIGKSGTGKELVANNIHYHSKRKFEKFVPVNCGSLPDHLIESELFGFEKGAFTGAHAGKKGLFEIANRGTIFLDEITELPANVQSSLLRVLQEGEIDKIGRTEKVNVDVRVIAATNKNLKLEVKEKRFREDLYFRLNVIPITVPALKERKEDVFLLWDHFSEKFGNKMNTPVPTLSEGAIEILVNYDWPGNVRELENITQRLLFLENRAISEDNVRKALGLFSVDEQTSSQTDLWDRNDIKTWSEIEELLKTRYFKFVRENTDSDAEAARKLGLAPPNYHRMSKKLGLK